jgi:hypothetical protein
VIAAHCLATRVRTLTFAILLCGASALAQAQDTPQKSAPHAAASGAPDTAAAQQSAPAAAAQPAPADAASEDHPRYPNLLANSYVGFQLAYLNYHFSDRELEPGFRSGSVAVPHLAARVDLFGHRFNDYLSVQAVYMRPAAYVTYRNVNGDNQSHHVWMNFGAATLQAQYPVTSSISPYIEAGWGIVSRRGFDNDGVPVVRNAHFKSAVLGGGLLYHADEAWDLVAGVTYTPPHPRYNQPASAFVSVGARYNLTQEMIERNRAAEPNGYILPENIVQLEYGTGHGYSVNHFLSSKVPIFWNGNVEIERGVAVHYDRNVFHTRRFFALDVGTSISYWRSRVLIDKFVTASVYPLLRFTLVRTKPADFFAMYSFAGPTYISKIIIDNLGTGSHFTFQDFVGAGVFIGEARNVSLGFKITHYSNGNLFIDNPGLKIPVTLTLGYAF